MAKVAVLLANGCEEIEAVTVIDVLRRAQIQVSTLALQDLKVVGAHGIEWKADALLSDEQHKTWDMVVLPGGQPGSDSLRDDPRVASLLEKQLGQKRWVAAICAAPIALGKNGMLKGRRATCYPGFEDQLIGAHVVNEPVVVDGEIITSRGPGTALDFAFELVSILKGKVEADKIRQGMLVRI